MANAAKRSFYIDMLGCEKRKLDSERIIQFMKLNGYEHITEDADIGAADVVIFSSCAFTDEAKQLSAARIGQLNATKNEKAKFVLAGCLSEISPDFVLENKIDHHLGPRSIEVLDNIIPSEVSIAEIPDPNTSYFDSKIHVQPDQEYRSDLLEEYSRAKDGFKIRVDWGCVSNCSFCAIKKATKDIKSKRLQDIEEEMWRGITAGHREFFITGGDVGAYGLDIGTDIVALMRSITSFKNVSLYVQELNIQWIIRHAAELSDVLLANIDNYDKLFISAPVQSGSNRVLKRMKRGYTTERICDAVKTLRANNPKLRLGSHFITGFPGEDEYDHELSKQLMRDLDLEFCMVFVYTDHTDVPSSKLDRKVDWMVAIERRLDLLDIQRVNDERMGRSLGLNKIVREVSGVV